jgi:hypothetical protein
MTGQLDLYCSGHFLRREEESALRQEAIKFRASQTVNKVSEQLLFLRRRRRNPNRRGLLQWYRHSRPLSHGCGGQGAGRFAVIWGESNPIARSNQLDVILLVIHIQGKERTTHFDIFSEQCRSRSLVDCDNFETTPFKKSVVYTIVPMSSEYNRHILELFQDDLLIVELFIREPKTFLSGAVEAVD